MPESWLIQTFELAGGKGKPRYGKINVCWARDEPEARRMAQSVPSVMLNTAALDVTLPAYFAQVLVRYSAANIAELLCSADSAKHIAAIREFAAAGYDRVYVHHVGPDQEGFLRFYRREVLPNFPP